MEAENEVEETEVQESEDSDEIFPNFIIRKAVSKFLKEPIADPITKNQMPKLRVKPEAIDLITEKLNIYIMEQIILLRANMPRKQRGNEKGELKKNIMDIQKIESTEFPRLPPISSQSQDS